MRFATSPVAHYCVLSNTAGGELARNLRHPLPAGFKMFWVESGL